VLSDAEHADRTACGQFGGVVVRAMLKALDEADRKAQEGTDETVRNDDEVEAIDGTATGHK
jgi:hypothetical protein